MTEINFARPADSRVIWMAYIGNMAVREMTNGTFQVKTGDGDWWEVDR